tara:strand:- start:232 stop:333 length:102 start_codon:yes stop_codon:yes gene_type:complete
MIAVKDLIEGYRPGISVDYVEKPTCALVKEDDE